VYSITDSGSLTYGKLQDSKSQLSINVNSKLSCTV